MLTVTVTFGEQVKSVEIAPGTLLGAAIAATELPLEQPCAGRGTCGKCKVLVEQDAAQGPSLAPCDEIERKHLTPGELAVGYRLACRALVRQDVRVTLAPIVVYSNKIFRSSTRYLREDGPLGLAIDLGSTTVAAFLTMLDTGEVAAGGASLNQQTVFGADVISRIAAATRDPADARRLRRLALASINQAVDSLRLSRRVRQRIERVTIVGNVAMHHLLMGLPVESLAGLPFQPYNRAAVRDGAFLMEGIFGSKPQVLLPPLIGGFVGSDALACLAYFGFPGPDAVSGSVAPMAAIDLGTNGEVMITDGRRVLTASTAAGPAFEGVNISCGTRAVDGAVVSAALAGGEFAFETIGEAAPIGLTGSGLLSVIHALRAAGVIDRSGRILPEPPCFADGMDEDVHGARRIQLIPGSGLRLSQWDVRELQKAKGAIRAAVDILLARLGLQPADLQRVILTGSFGGQIDLDAALALGMIPPVRREVVETVANGAGFGAALFLSDAGFALGERLAAHAEQVDLDLDPDFDMRYINALALAADLE